MYEIKIRTILRKKVIKSKKIAIILTYKVLNPRLSPRNIC